MRYHNQTTMQLQMLEFAKQRLASDDEVGFSVDMFLRVGELQHVSGQGVIFHHGEVQTAYL